MKQDVNLPRNWIVENVEGLNEQLAMICDKERHVVQLTRIKRHQLDIVLERIF